MPRFVEATELVDVGPDRFGRPARLEATAARFWRGLQAAAQADGIQLLLVSAFRSVERQRELLTAKLAAGQTLLEALRYTAYPGHSEHHTGRAVDLGSAACEPLIEAFAATAEFAWLEARAADFEFTLSYDRGNRDSIGFEPWHWCFRRDLGSSRGGREGALTGKEAAPPGTGPTLTPSELVMPSARRGRASGGSGRVGTSPNR